MNDKQSLEARELLKSVLELETKALNYLLVANGAGLAGCLAAVKDYANVPQLHGIGTLIVIFSVGLIAASAAFLFFQMGSFEMMRHVTIGNETPTRGKIKVAVMNHLMSGSGACFVFAVLIIAKRLSHL